MLGTVSAAVREVEPRMRVCNGPSGSSGGGRGAMPTVCGTCAGAVVVTVRECVLAIGS